MSTVLENITDKYCLHIHNDGTCTYHSGNFPSTPDVTISTGFSSYGNIKWSIITDDLKSPHDGILIEVGTTVYQFRKEVIDWSKFDWTTYKDLTREALHDLFVNWTNTNFIDVEDMAKELNDKIHECVDEVAVTKIVTGHSKP